MKGHAGACFVCTEITDHKLVYDQESRYLGNEITGNLQKTTSNLPRGCCNSYYTGLLPFVAICGSNVFNNIKKITDINIKEKQA